MDIKDFKQRKSEILIDKNKAIKALTELYEDRLEDLFQHKIGDTIVIKLLKSYANYYSQTYNSCSKGSIHTVLIRWIVLNPSGVSANIGVLTSGNNLYLRLNTNNIEIQ